MSTKAKSSYQDPRYLQLWLVFDWPQPADRVQVACVECGWRGRRCRRSVTGRPCPRCDGAVSIRRTGHTSPVAGRTAKDNVVPLRGRQVGRPGGQERPAPRMVSGRRVRGR